jgi:hypothetical protein
MSIQKQFFVVVLIVLGFLVATSPVEVSASSEPSGLICPSRLQLRHSTRCANGGERDEMSQLAVQGFFPERTLPTYSVDPTLGKVPYYYLKSMKRDGTPVYGSYENAMAGENPAWTLDPGFVYLSWIDRIERDNKVIYMIAPGVYIEGGNASRISIPSFRGLAFYRTPYRAFAWVLMGTETSRAPGSDQPKADHWLNRYDLVWIYDVERVGDYDWYQVGQDEWIEQRLVAVAEPDTSRPDGVQSDRWITVNLYEQTLMVYEDGRMIYATLVSSGLGGWWTKPGVFQVFEKLEADKMSGAFESDRSDYYYLEDVPWILYYDESRALHGAYWHNRFGWPRSHGCVNLPVADAHWLYDWAEEGTWVYVFDPSGETPTEDSEYGPGGT